MVGRAKSRAELFGRERVIARAFDGAIAQMHHLRDPLSANEVRAVVWELQRGS